MAKLPTLHILNYKECSVFQNDLIQAEKQKQQFRAQALALYALQQISQIKVTFTDDYIDYFQEFLPDELKQQLT